MTESTIKTLQQLVAERIEKSTDAVREQFVEAKAQAERNSRADALATAYDTLDKLNKELSKIDRPDVITTDRSGKPVGEGTYTKKRADQIKKTEEITAKWDAALASAWDGDFKKLREILKNPPKIEESKDE